MALTRTMLQRADNGGKWLQREIPQYKNSLTETHVLQAVFLALAREFYWSSTCVLSATCSRPGTSTCEMAHQAQSRTQARRKTWLIINHGAAMFLTMALLECQAPGGSYTTRHSPECGYLLLHGQSLLLYQHFSAALPQTVTFSCNTARQQQQ